jgi:hypothetical protein
MDPMRRVTLFLTIWTAVAIRPAWADNWVDAIFPERQFDFGTVARGSKVHHAFKLINRTDQEIHIADWRTKCGCTAVRVGARVIPPGTQTVIEAAIDTTNFQGYKPSGLTLVIDRPRFAEVNLNLTCFIRNDVVFSPGQVDFGRIGRTAKPTVQVNLTYAGGQADWGITRMRTQSPHVLAKSQEQARSPGGQVQYLLTVTLNPAAITGYFKDEITLFTNDPTSPTIPISVSANVQAAVIVSPTILNLGRVKAGDVVKDLKVLVRSAQPFQVTGLKANKTELSAAPDPDGARPLHTVNLTFKAPKQSGPYHAVFEIATDLKGEPPARIATFATIVP